MKISNKKVILDGVEYRVAHTETRRVLSIFRKTRPRFPERGLSVSAKGEVALDLSGPRAAQVVSAVDWGS